MRRISTTLALAGAAGALLAAPAAAVTRTVDDDQQQCPAAAFTTVQAAIDASGPGDRVLVCDGRYTENVTIGAGKDRLRVVSDETRGAIIRAANPAFNGGAVVHITGGVQGVRFDRFQVTGPGSGGLQFLVLVDGGADVASMRDSLLRVARNNSFAGIGATALRVGGAGLGWNLGGGSTGTVRDFSDNELDRYVRNGIEVMGDGSVATLTHNTMRGLGTQGLTQNNGIIVRDGARAAVVGNRITGHGGLGTAYGVLLDAAAAGTRVTNNYLDDNEAGIALQGTDQALVRRNVVPRNDDGISVDSGSTGNRLEANDAKTNESADCTDESVGTGTAGTANTWVGNRGVLVSRPGICSP